MVKKYEGSRKGFQYMIQSEYGLSLHKYDTIVVEQLGCCKICRKQTELNVDHNHSLRKGDPKFIRGLLCAPCNAFMGKVDRDWGILERIAGWSSQINLVGHSYNSWRYTKYAKRYKL